MQDRDPEAPLDIDVVEVGAVPVSPEHDDPLGVERLQRIVDCLSGIAVGAYHEDMHLWLRLPGCPAPYTAWPAVAGGRRKLMAQTLPDPPGPPAPPGSGPGAALARAATRAAAAGPEPAPDRTPGSGVYRYIDSNKSA